MQPTLTASKSNMRNLGMAREEKSACSLAGPMLIQKLTIEKQQISTLQKWHYCRWPMSACCVKSLCFESITKNIISRLAKFIAEKKLYASTNSLWPYIVRDIFYMTARLFTSKKAEEEELNSLRGRDVDIFERFLCVWSKPTTMKRK